MSKELGIFEVKMTRTLIGKNSGQASNEDVELEVMMMPLVEGMEVEVEEIGDGDEV
jgi:hypothetical protein